MQDLVRLCELAGFDNVRTYIASGNVVFSSRKGEAAVKAALERQLHDYAGKAVGVLVRSLAEMTEILAQNPFPKAAKNTTVAICLDAPPGENVLADVTGQVAEELALGKREIYVSYGAGMGRSKLKIPGAKTGTARNMNTIAKLVEIAGSLDNAGK